MNHLKKGFLILCFIFIAAPLFFFPVFGHQGAESDASEKKLPAFSIRFLSDLGDYFSANFAFRRQFVESDARIKESLFQTSSLPEKVIVGKDGWLFQYDTLDDFYKKQTLSDEALDGIAYNLSLLESQLTADGKKFLFFIAPNKNSLYPWLMPDRMQKVRKRNGSNADLLLRKLSEYQVSAVDLYDLFEADTEIRYHQTDSHWTAYGAAMASHSILSAINKKHTDFTKIPYTRKQDFSGDVYRMLYPDSEKNDWEDHFQQDFSFSYLTEIESTFDPEIETENPSKKGSVLMFRDSFGNALLPFIAEEYQSGYFTRDALYPVYKAYEKEDDMVLFEIVERHLSYLLSHAPVIALDPVEPEDLNHMLQKVSEKRSLPGDSLSVSQDPNSGLLQVSGSMDKERLSLGPSCFVCFENEEGERLFFPAFRGGVSGLEEPETGVCSYIDLEDLDFGTYSVSLMTETYGEFFWSDTLETFSLE